MAAAAATREELRIAVQSSPWILQRDVPVTLSLGVAIGGGPQPPDISALPGGLRTPPLPKPKNAGRNQVELAAAEPGAIPGVNAKKQAERKLCHGLKLWNNGRLETSKVKKRIL